jgi:hypothetical protein
MPPRILVTLLSLALVGCIGAPVADTTDATAQTADPRPCLKAGLATTLAARDYMAVCETADSTDLLQAENDLRWWAKVYDACVLEWAKSQAGQSPARTR